MIIFLINYEKKKKINSDNVLHLILTNRRRNLLTPWRNRLNTQMAHKVQPCQICY